MEGKEQLHGAGRATSKAHSFGIISLSVLVVGLVVSNVVMYYYIFQYIDQVCIT